MQTGASAAKRVLPTKSPTSEIMNLTNPEKLILVMLSEIHAGLKIKDGIDPDLVASAIQSGNTWGISWQYGMLLDGGDATPDHVNLCTEILSMWSDIESSFEQLTPEEKEKVRAEAAPFSPGFGGFDGNEESSYLSAARFLVDNLGRFGNFKGRRLDGGVHTLPAHRRMLTTHSAIREGYSPGPLNAAQITRLLASQRWQAAKS